MTDPGPLRDLQAARKALRSGRESPEKLLERAADRSRELDRGGQPVRAFLHACGGAGSEDGSNGARRDSTGAGGAPERPPDAPPPGEGPLAGVPVAVKDNICTLEFPTTCASRLLEGYRSPFEATAVRRLRAAGARVFGKTNLDEFAMGSSTENSAFGPTRNPMDRERVPGGSSGGSAAAVAGGVVPVALGSETGGSVRQPAAFCGLVGVKPTYGRVSRYGLVAFGSSLDQIGVFGRSVRDAARVLETISGGDRRDATCRDRPPPRADALEGVELSEQTIGIAPEYMGRGLDDGVRGRVEEAAAVMADAGADVREVSVPSPSEAVSCYYVIAPAEASSNLSRFDGVRYGSRQEGDGSLDGMYRATRGRGFGPEVKRRVMLGTFALSAGYYDAYYRRARALQRRIARRYRGLFEEDLDALFTPTTPTTAFRLGEKTDDPYRMYLSDVYTVSANLAGIPAVSLPVGRAGGLPVGGQLMCGPWEEERMLGIAAALEERLEAAGATGGGPPREAS